MKTEKFYSWVLRISNSSAGEVEYRTCIIVICVWVFLSFIKGIIDFDYEKETSVC